MEKPERLDVEKRMGFLESNLLSSSHGFLTLLTSQHSSFHVRGVLNGDGGRPRYSIYIAVDAWYISGNTKVSLVLHYCNEVRNSSNLNKKGQFCLV